MKTNTTQFAALALILCAGGLGLAAPAKADDRPAPDPAAGQAAFQQHCSRCHGVTGAGDGRDAKRLFPRPRDLTSGVFKFRSTATDTVATDDDLFHTLDHGLTPGGMPDWSHLDESTRWQLVYYLKTLSTKFETNPPEVVDIGKDPGPRATNLAKGKEVYEKLGCAACHGATGRANGSSAATLQDQWERPTRPANLAQGWSYRGGSDVKSIVTRIMAGIDGSPMPSYAEAVSSKDDVWQLAYYVRSLQQEPSWKAFVKAKRVAGPLPSAADDARWQQAERTDVRLRQAVNAAGEINAPLTVGMVSVQSVYNDDAISFRIAWPDPSQDRESPPDTLAVVLRPADVQGDVVTLQNWPLRDSPPLDFLVWQANRSATGPSGQAQEAILTRYDSIVQGTLSGVPLTSEVEYDNGEWVMVITRPRALTGSNAHAAQITAELAAPIGFVVWDGGNPGLHAISPWLDLELSSDRQAHGGHEGHGGGHAAKPSAAAGVRTPDHQASDRQMADRQTIEQGNEPSSAARQQPVEVPAPVARKPFDRSALPVWVISAIVLIVALGLVFKRR